MTGLEVVFGAAAIGLGAIGRRFQFRRTGRRRGVAAGADQPIVTLAGRGAILPVPNLRDAYSALPSYCWDVLGR